MHEGGGNVFRLGASVLVTAALVCAHGPVRAQQQPDPLFIPKGTLVPVELAAAVSSETARDGDRFPIRIFEPVFMNGATIIPLGALGEGEVIHAANARGSGMPGELIVAVRFVRCGAIRIPIGHLQFSESGHDATMAWIVQRSIFRYPGKVSGGAIELPVGTRGIAKVTDSVALPSGETCQANSTPSEQGSAQ